MSFDDSVNKALEDSKYDDLTGRSFDLDALFPDLNINSEPFNAPDLPFFSGENLFIILITIAIGVLIFLLGLLIFHIVRRSHKKENMSMGDLFDELRDKNLTYGDLRKKVELFVAMGDFRQGVRYEFLSLLWVLNSKKIISINKSKTNNQLKRDIGKTAPAILLKFNESLDIFNPIWFGHKAIKKENYDVYANVFSEAIKEVKAYEKPY